MVIVPAHVTPERVRTTPWEEVGPGLVFLPVPDSKEVKNRLHLDLAPHDPEGNEFCVLSSRAE